MNKADRWIFLKLGRRVLEIPYCGIDFHKFVPLSSVAHNVQSRVRAMICWAVIEIKMGAVEKTAELKKKPLAKSPR